jgi:hypothetical protein
MDFSRINRADDTTVEAMLRQMRRRRDWNR